MRDLDPTNRSLHIYMHDKIKSQKLRTAAEIYYIIIIRINYKVIMHAYAHAYILIIRLNLLYIYVLATCICAALMQYVTRSAVHDRYRGFNIFLELAIGSFNKLFLKLISHSTDTV
jgi:hypothetical protein